MEVESFYFLSICQVFHVTWITVFFHHRLTFLFLYSAGILKYIFATRIIIFILIRRIYLYRIVVVLSPIIRSTDIIDNLMCVNGVKIKCLIEKIKIDITLLLSLMHLRNNGTV